MRRSELRSLDVKDLQPDDHALFLEHRPDQDTQLKNGEDGERYVYLGPKWYGILEEYLDHPDRYEVTDEYGRQPLITTKFGRPTGDTIYKWTNKATQPCEYGECPHDRDPATCEARSMDNCPNKCPSARSPHAIRRSAATHHLNEGTPAETVSERMDMSLGVLYKHYDARTLREKMNVRRDQLPK